MKKLLGFNRARFRFPRVLLLTFLWNLNVCWSLSTEGLALLKLRERVVRDPFGALSDWDDGDGILDPCSWFGVECSDGQVVILNLKDLCLQGTLAPELAKLAYIKSIILRNNSFSGNVPKEIGELRELEVLDLGHNNLSGPLPSELSNSLSLSILLLDNNNLLGSISPELFELRMLSEFQVDEKQFSSANIGVSCSSKHTSWSYLPNVDTTPMRQLQLADDPSHSTTKRTSNKYRASQSLLPPSPLVMPPYSPISSISIPPFISPSSPSESPFYPPAVERVPSFSPISPTSLPLSRSPLSPSESPLSPSPTSSSAPSPSLSPSLSPKPISPTLKNPSIIVSVPAVSRYAPGPSPVSTIVVGKSSKTKDHTILILSGVIGGSFIVIFLAIGLIFCQHDKMASIKPWVTGLSGQLQKSLVTGVPKLKRSELEIACEDFSNIIDSLTSGTVYKGTLSSGVEVAVKSVVVTSPKDWTKNSDVWFRKKIEILSKVNHKNFVNLIGYCEEEEPFTRMMVFEYAPNGTLFEHLHIREAERLDWRTRLRIAMGIAYCLEHMHRLNPPVVLKNLKSSSVYLTDDYAAKVSDFSFWDESTEEIIGSPGLGMQHLESTPSDSDIVVYSFGLILLQIVTACIPCSDETGSFAKWAEKYLSRKRFLRDLVDPTLKSFEEVELDKLLGVIEDCVHHDKIQRPSVAEVAARLKEITTIEPDGASPKLSPLLWAELEIMSSEAS